jgi:hypothetical protein
MIASQMFIAATAWWRRCMLWRLFSLGVIAALASACQQQPELSDSGEIIPVGHFGETITYTLAFNKNGGTYKYVCENDDQLDASYTLKIHVPIIIRTCQNYYTRVDAVYAIYMHDGPFYESFIDRLDTHNLPLKHGFVIVEPRYPGSKERPWRVSPNAPDFATFETSRSELLALIAHYRSIGRKFILVGDGFGSLIIASVLDQLRSQESVILYTPVLKASEPDIENIITADQRLRQDYASHCKTATKPTCGDRREWILNNVYQNWRHFSATVEYAKSGFEPKIWIVSGDEATAAGNADARAFAAAFPKSVKISTVPELTRDGFTNIAQFNQAEKFLAPVLALGKLKDNDK